MWRLRSIFGKDAHILARLLGIAAFGCLGLASYNIYVDGLPSIPLLIYRGGLIFVGLGLYYLAAFVGQRLN